MAKFIEVHKGDAPYLLNLDTVRLMIGAAQGGIPMDTGGSY